MQSTKQWFSWARGYALDPKAVPCICTNSKVMCEFFLSCCEKDDAQWRNGNNNKLELNLWTDWRQTAFQAWNLSHACIHYKASTTVRTALVCSALRSGGNGVGAALAGAAENLRDLTTTMLVCGVCYTDDDVVVCSQYGLNSKNPPNMGFKTIVELTGCSYDCINLTILNMKPIWWPEKEIE